MGDCLKVSVFLGQSELHQPGPPPPLESRRAIVIVQLREVDRYGSSIEMFQFIHDSGFGYMASAASSGRNGREQKVEVAAIMGCNSWIYGF